MKIKITTLTENTANHGFIGEWGLSILIELDGSRILMDTGMSFTAAHNAQSLGIDLKSIDTIVLSHGHRDHTGGLRDILTRRSEPVKVIAHPDIWAKKYTRTDTGKRYSGIPFSRDFLESLGASFELSRKPVRVTEHVMTTGEIPMVCEYEAIDDNFMVRRGTTLGPDTLADDLALIIQTDRGLVVILGCAHHGMVNTLRHAQKLTGGEQVYAVIGGTHLVRASEERIAQTVADLKEMGVQKIAVSHCTGFNASLRLAEEFGEAFFMNNAGSQLTLP